MRKYHKAAWDCPVCGGAMYGEYDTCGLCGYEVMLAYGWAHLYDENRVIITYALPWTLKESQEEARKAVMPMRK